MKTRKPFVVPALAGILPFRLKAVQQTTRYPLACASGLYRKGSST